MRKPLLWGIAAGAAGTIALDVVTYLAMVVRAPAGQLHAGPGGRRPGRARRRRAGRRR